jgi:hypothetical protein
MMTVLEGFLGEWIKWNVSVKPEGKRLVTLSSFHAESVGFVVRYCTPIQKMGSGAHFLLVFII